MYAIIKSGSRQYQVRPESIIAVNRLPLEAGAAFETDQVLLCEEEGAEVQVGAPLVSGAVVRGKVLDHYRDTKVLVFKHKRRKNYRRTRGHRQELTRLLIETIEVGGKTYGSARPAKAPKAPKAQAATGEEEQAGPAKAPAKTSAKAPAKDKAPAKAKAPAKKPAAKASTAKRGTGSSAKAGGKPAPKGRAGTAKSGAKRSGKDKASKD